DAAVAPDAQVQGVLQVDETEHSLQEVISVGALADHVQEQVEFRGSRNVAQFSDHGSGLMTRRRSTSWPPSWRAMCNRVGPSASYCCAVTCQPACSKTNGRPSSSRRAT